jgi:hypothetical protein
MRQVLHDPIEQIAGANPVIGGHGHRVTEAQFVEFNRHVFAIDIVDLVRNQNGWFVSATEEIRDIVVTGRDTCFRIDHEYDHVGFIHGALGLVARPLGDFNGRGLVDFGSVLKSGRIDDRELDSAPGCCAVETIPSGTRNVLDNGSSFTDESIEERGFADIGSANNRDYRSCHIITSVS